MVLLQTSSHAHPCWGMCTEKQSAEYGCCYWVTSRYSFFSQKNNDTLPTSNNPTAMDKATPVDLRGRLPCETGQGSRWSSDNKSVKAISHLCTGCKNLFIKRNTLNPLFPFNRVVHQDKGIVSSLWYVYGQYRPVRWQLLLVLGPLWTLWASWLSRSNCSSADTKHFLNK